jgi:hypothetical protein
MDDSIMILNVPLQRNALRITSMRSVPSIETPPNVPPDLLMSGKCEIPSVTNDPPPIDWNIENMVAEDPFYIGRLFITVAINHT